MRQIILDTETTGLEAAAGHRVIEIGLVELVNRRPTGRVFHRYLNPERPVDEEAQKVHGLTDGFLKDQPKFAAVAEEFLQFVVGAELLAHNAAFDMGFLEAELARLQPAPSPLASLCTVVDTLKLAKQRHPGQRNSLDALCKRYSVDNSNRDLHGALLDARLLADVYLAMTGGQSSLGLDVGNAQGGASGGAEQRRVRREPVAVLVVEPTAEEWAEHKAACARIAKAAGGTALFTSFDPS
jgi:DNA polymerase-3 subunit epsilon